MPVLPPVSQDTRNTRFPQTTDSPKIRSILPVVVSYHDRTHRAKPERNMADGETNRSNGERWKQRQYRSGGGYIAIGESKSREHGRSLQYALLDGQVGNIKVGCTAE